MAHLTDAVLLRELAALVAEDRTTIAALLAHVAEVDARKLYVPAGYPSMLLYCVHELHLSEDSALKRIRGARIARQFPLLFEALADGRLNLSGVIMLKPYLTLGNVDQLLGAAAHKTNAEIEDLLAQRFPRTEMLAMVETIPASLPCRDDQLAARPVGELAQGAGAPAGAAPRLAAQPVEVPRPKLAPVASERYALHLTMGKSTHDKLRHAQALLSHPIPSGDLAQVLDRALDLAIAQLEKRKFAATNRPRKSGRPTTSQRHVPAHVRRAVWKRDGGQCTFVSDAGHRCASRRRLEYDHIDPVARGGKATVAGIRLRCRAHNQLEAERAFGVGFMERKREEARAAADARAIAKERANEVVPYLRRLGFRADETRRAAELCENIPEAPLEERVRLALTYFRLGVRTPAPAAAP